MAEAGECKENPFSFKNFVKSKQETTSPKTNKAQRKQKSKESTGNLRNQNHFKDEAPFPEVNKEGTKLINTTTNFSKCALYWKLRRILAEDIRRISRVLI